MHHFGIDNLQPQTVQGGAPKIAVSWFTTPITMVHGRYIYSSEFINQLITRGAPPCSFEEFTSFVNHAGRVWSKADATIQG